MVVGVHLHLQCQQNNIQHDEVGEKKRFLVCSTIKMVWAGAYGSSLPTYINDTGGGTMDRHSGAMVHFSFYCFSLYFYSISGTATSGRVSSSRTPWLHHYHSTLLGAEEPHQIIAGTVCFDLSLPTLVAATVLNRQGTLRHLSPFVTGRKRLDFHMAALSAGLRIVRGVWHEVRAGDGWVDGWMV